MVKATLVEEDKTAGRKFLQRADEEALDIRAALWVYREEGEYWWLVLASPIVDQFGKQEMYSRIYQIWSKERDLDWSRITVVRTDDKLIRRISEQVHTGDEIKGFWFQGGYLTDLYVDECYIYRMNL